MDRFYFSYYTEREEMLDIKNNIVGQYWIFANSSLEEIRALQIDLYSLYELLTNIKDNVLRDKMKIKIIELFKSESLEYSYKLFNTDLLPIKEMKEIFKDKCNKALLCKNEDNYEYTGMLYNIKYIMNNSEYQEICYQYIIEIINIFIEAKQYEFLVNAIESFSMMPNVYHSLLTTYNNVLPKEYHEILNANNNSNYINERTVTDDYLDIGIDPKISIGLEIETNYKYPFKFNVSNQNGYHEYHVTSDATVPNGMEIDCPPFHNSKDEVLKFNKLFDTLTLMGYYYDETSCNAAGQINLGLDYLDTAQDILTFYEIYCNCEELLYYISSEEGQIFRQDVYCSSRIKPISEAIGNRIFDEDITRDQVIKFFQNDNNKIKGIMYKKNSVCLRGDCPDNFRFEFRIPNGGVNFKTWIDNIRLYGKMMEVTKKISSALKKEYLTEEEERLLNLKFGLEDKNLSLDEKLVILMELLFKDNEIKKIYINRYKSVINRINTEGVQNYKNAMNFYEPSFASSEFVYKYSSKIPSLDDDLPTASYDYNTGEYKENRKR